MKAIRAANPQPAARYSVAAVPETNAIDAVKGQANAGMYKVQIGRQVMMHGKPAGNQMGVNTWAAFAGTDTMAFADGDFAVSAVELQPVLRSLRKSGINIVAIHNHMTHEQPQLIFLHYWGKGPAAEVARALRAAFDAQRQ